MATRIVVPHARVSAVDGSVTRLLYDDLALPSALAALDHARPDIVEVLPGVIFPLVVDRIRARVPLPIIVGGFVTEPEQRNAVLERGALAISTGTTSLWP